MISSASFFTWAVPVLPQMRSPGHGGLRGPCRPHLPHPPASLRAAISRLRGLHAQLIPHPAAGKDDRRLARGGVRRFDPVHQPRPEHLAAVGDGRGHHGHLQRRDGHRALADAEVGGVAHRTSSAPTLLEARENARRLLACRQAGAFAEVQPLAKLHDVRNPRHVQAVGDEVGVAGDLQSAAEIVGRRRGARSSIALRPMSM